MGDVQIKMSVPLDSDGFLRRECPTCEREFKWRHTPSGEQSVAAPDAGYFCPYCTSQAPAGSWWTKPQVEAQRSRIYDEVVKPKLDDFADSARQASAGFIKIDVTTTGPAKPPPLTESDDMRRVDFECHPTEPLKVLEDWNQPVHCLVCGAVAP
jgi:hypothetical protein